MTSHSETGEQTIAVLGGRGFVGAAITKRLIASGRRPHLFGLPMQDDLLAGCTGRFDETAGSVEDAQAIANALTSSGASAIVTTVAHSAGRAGLMRSGDAESAQALAVNVLGLRNTLEAARKAGISRVIWTSSTVVYGDADGYGEDRVDEDAPRRPQTFYGLTKQLAEDVAAYYRNRHAIDVVGLRLPLVLGEGLWYQGAASAIAAMIADFGAGKPHHAAFHDDAMDLMHVTDVADAVLTVLDRSGPADAIYNINGFTARFSDLVAALKHRDPKAVITVDRQAPELTFPLIDDARFRARFSFTPAFALEDVISSLLNRIPAHV